MIEIKDVSKWYGNKAVVDNVSLQIQKGKITSLIGANGAGKSTLLSMVSRLIEKNDGEIFIEGKEIGQYESNELAKKISILKQAYQLHIRLTIKDLVGFGRFPYSQGRLTKEDEQYVREAIDYMELRDIENKYLDQLSGGQKQRAFIAMVLAQNTDYILLDEPLNNLDMKHSAQIMKVLRRLVEELGKTIVLVLHDINFASFYSDDIVAMKDGKIIREGNTDVMMDTAVLEHVYDMEIPIQTVSGNRLAVYY